MNTNLKDDAEYTLVDGAAWLYVKGFAIRIHSTDEGVVVDVFAKDLMDADPFCGSLSSTYAYDSECVEDV